MTFKNSLNLFNSFQCNDTEVCRGDYSESLNMTCLTSKLWTEGSSQINILRLEIGVIQSPWKSQSS